MKSGLEGRNNLAVFMLTNGRAVRLNEVRPRRPEQSISCGFRVSPWRLSQ